MAGFVAAVEHYVVQHHITVVEEQLKYVTNIVNPSLYIYNTYGVMIPEAVTASHLLMGQVLNTITTFMDNNLAEGVSGKTIIMKRADTYMWFISTMLAILELQQVISQMYTISST